MTRESKNNNDGAVFTYHERRNLRHRTQRLRLPAAALKPWHHCALRLSPAEAPVLTPHGVLYDREAILLNLLQQKRQLRAQRVATHAQETLVRRHRALRLDARRREEEAAFADRQQSLRVRVHRPAHERLEDPTLDSNFWLPGSCPPRDASGEAARPAKRRRKDAPPAPTLCPVTGTPLKSRDLIALKPTRVEKRPRRPGSHDDPDPDPDSARSRHDVSFMCPVCRTGLVNSARPVALRTGTVVCRRCADDFVRKDARDPIVGTQLRIDSDVIEIQNSGTAFAASSSDNPASKEAKLYRPSVR